jgi:RNA polymerase I-specific transcription initiation factor RRN3
LDDDLEEELLSNQFEGTEYSSEDDINTEPPNIDDATESSSGILDINTSLTTLRDTITTLDALMTTLFTYIDPLFPTDSEPSLEAEQLFDSLLSTFLLHILPTYHSRHAQFLVFKTSQSHSLFLDKFLGLLIERSLNPTISNIGRQASSAYLASFVARAKSLTPDTIKTVVEMLCVFLSRVLEDMPITAQGKFIPGGVAGNRGLDGVYSVFQAVIYIYCFRWRELQTVDEESGEHIWLPQLNVIQRMAWSPLNPLAVFTLVFAVANCSIFHLMLHRSLPNGHTIYSIFSSIQYSKKMPARES